MKIIENNISYTTTHWQTKLMSDTTQVCWISIERRYQDKIFFWKLEMWFFNDFYKENKDYKLLNNILKILNLDKCSYVNSIIKRYNNFENDHYLEKPFEDKDLIIKYLEEYE